MRSESVSTLYINYDRQDSMGLTESSGSLNSYNDSNETQYSRASHYSDDSSCSNTSSSYFDPQPAFKCKEMKGLQMKVSSTDSNKALKSAKKGIPTFGGLTRGFNSRTGSCTNLKACKPNLRSIKPKSK